MKILREYINSIRGNYFIGAYAIFNIGLLFGEPQPIHFLLLGGLFLLMSVAIYIKYKYRLL
jgi:hypothetical protein